MSTVSQRKAQIRSLLSGKGYSKQGTAAVMANIDVQTGGTFDYKQKQKGGGPGYGLFQMEKPMQNKYNQYLSQNSVSDSAESQVDFMHATLTEPQYRQHIGEGNANKIHEALQGEDLEYATAIFCNKFERPGVPHLSRRFQSGRGFLKSFDSGSSHYKNQDFGTFLCDQGNTGNFGSQNDSNGSFQEEQYSENEDEVQEKQSGRWDKKYIGDYGYQKTCQISQPYHEEYLGDFELRFKGYQEPEDEDYKQKDYGVSDHSDEECLEDYGQKNYDVLEPHNDYLEEYQHKYYDTSEPFDTNYYEDYGQKYYGASKPYGEDYIGVQQEVLKCLDNLDFSCDNDSYSD